MAVPLDLDQLQTFCTIADCGSFTEAARHLNKTQSAVSMQIKRLEERLGVQLFAREGRNISLSSEGNEVYGRARRMLRVNAEIVDLFSTDDLSGSIRFGVPDDYAVRILPVILSRFQKTNPRIMVDVKCMPSESLLEGMHSGRFDLIIFTQGTLHEFGELFRTEEMHWVGKQGGLAHKTDPLPIACGPQTCCWRKSAIDSLDRNGIDYRIAYTSSDATSITSAVSSDLAVGVLPESAVRHDMVKLEKKHGLPRLPEAQIALLRASHAYGGIYDALAEHITASLGNLSGRDPLLDDEATFQVAAAE